MKIPAVLMVIALVVLGILEVGSASYRQAVPQRSFQFPQDHGKHTGFKTEWWYFTGNLTAQDGKKFGYQLTFFRVGLTLGKKDSKSAWAIQDLYPAHFAITNISEGKFFHSDIITREGPGLASASSEDLDIKVKNWSAVRDHHGIKLFAEYQNHKLELRLIPDKPLVLHGDAGFSQKGANQDQASYYYSFTRMTTEGILVFAGNQFSVKGESWMDHEFGSSILSTNQVGWDWFSLQLNDGTELMISYLRRSDGTMDHPFGTLIQKDGTPINLREKEISVSKQGTWISPKTKTQYPSGWLIQIPELELSLQIQPSIKDQELVTKNSTGIVYWEGAVTVSGTKHNNSVTGHGYVELTGYAASMGGLI